MDVHATERGGEGRFSSDDKLVLDGLIRRVAQSDASRLALVGRGREITYNQLDALIDYMAYGLVNLGVKQGQRVALYMHNLPEFVIAFYAITRIGAVAVPINIFYQGQDLAYFLEHSGAVAIMTIAPYNPRIEEVRRYLPRLRWVIVLSGKAPQPPGTIAWEEVSEPRNADPLQSLAEPNDLAVLAYTAGTSGVPKGVRLSHRNLLTNCIQFENMRQVSFGYDREERREVNEVAMLPLGLTSLYALNIGLNLTMKVGGAVVIAERFDAPKSLQLLQEHNATILHGTPAIYAAWLAAAPPPAENIRRDVFRSVRYAFSYGAPLPRETAEGFEERVRRIPIFQCYTLTEASPVVACGAAAPSNRVNSVGWPLQAVPSQGIGGVALHVVDVTNQRQDVGVSSIGELTVSGDNMMQDYFEMAEFERELNAKEAGTELPAPRSRRLLTGDMGSVDPEGYFYVIDRKEDALVRANGQILLPVTIEEVLSKHEAVKEVAAVRVSDTSGPHFEAYVVLKDGYTNITERDLLQFSRRGRTLPEYHAPTRIYFLPYLPHLRSNWRIMRRALPASQTAS